MRHVNEGCDRAVRTWGVDEGCAKGCERRVWLRGKMRGVNEGCERGA